MEVYVLSFMHGGNSVGWIYCRVLIGSYEITDSFFKIFINKWKPLNYNFDIFVNILLIYSREVFCNVASDHQCNSTTLGKRNSSNFNQQIKKFTIHLSQLHVHFHLAGKRLKIYYNYMYFIMYKMLCTEFLCFCTHY